MREIAKETCCVNNFSNSTNNLYFGTGYPNWSYLNPSALNGRRKCVISIIECETQRNQYYRMILLPSADFIRRSLDIFILFFIDHHHNHHIIAYIGPTQFIVCAIMAIFLMLFRIGGIFIL